MKIYLFWDIKEKEFWCFIPDVKGGEPILVQPVYAKKEDSHEKSKEGFEPEH